MSEPERRPLLRNIVPAAVGFSVTFAAGMAATVFFLTGGFPDSEADRPAAGWESAPAIAQPTQVAIADPPAPPEPALKRERRDETPAERRPSARDAAAPARFNVDLDTESLDSILGTGSAFDADDAPYAAGDEDAPPGGAIPPEAVEDRQAAPEGEPAPEARGWDAP